MVVERALCGRARPYELGELAYALTRVIGERALRALEWLLAAERGFGGRRGVILSHAQLSQLLRCSEKTAGTAMRTLCDTGLVEQCPYFVPFGDKATRLGVAGSHTATDDNSWEHRWRELTPTYRTTARCAYVLRRRFDREARNRACARLVKTTDRQRAKLSLRESNSGVRARRPEQIFAEEMLAPPPKLKSAPAVARVRTILPDGSVLWGSMLSADAVAQRLGRRGAPATLDERRAARDDYAPDAVAAWRAWEATKGGGAK